MRLTKAAILSAEDLRTEEVDVPEWGGSVVVREFSAAARDAFFAATIRVRKDGTREPVLDGMNAKLVALSAVDENGDRMFTDAEIVELERKSAAAIERVAAVCSRLNRLSTQDVDDAGKNSESGQSGSSPSA